MCSRVGRERIEEDFMRAVPLTLIALIAFALCLPGPSDSAAGPASSDRFPWKQAGLSEREAAAHLLNRFSYGPRPGEIDRVLKIGLERWFERQLAARQAEPRLERLDELPALSMPAGQIARTYPPPGMLLREARIAGVIPGKERDDGESTDQLPDGLDRKEMRGAVERWARRQGYRSQRELVGQLMTQKVWRATEAENQLAEVMTDFWFNHFNVSLTDNQARGYVLSYERDAIRPGSLGDFRDLLGATARHPAMLLYLDNAQSAAPAEAVTTMEDELGRLPRRKQPLGLNENYARELLELHTLGVDGGYTQDDVIQVARAFTGWTLMPPGSRRREAEEKLRRARRAGGLGFVVDGELLFRADWHDAGQKIVLGKKLPAGRGIEDGEDVLDLLARHPATARHIARKLAVRFVSDEPPQALVDRLAGVFQKSGGDTREMLRILAASPEFWSRKTVGAKIKSPFELAASALRATGGRIEDPRDLLGWIARMGQPLYACQAPTGFPDRGEAWVNTGSLLQRMSFGLQLAAGRIGGLDVDLAALQGGREPASRDEALKAYAGLLLPGRNLDPVLAQLGPMIHDPGLAQKVDAATPQDDPLTGMAGMDDDPLASLDEKEPPRERRRGWKSVFASPPAPRDLHAPTPVEQVVGVILGSPEFQRR
jgi:uncharacterized protein (DUF1800 family)